MIMFVSGDALVPVLDPTEVGCTPKHEYHDLNNIYAFMQHYHLCNAS